MVSPSGGRSAESGRRLTAVAHAFLDQPRLIEQFVTVEHILLVETVAVLPEQQPHPFASAEAAPMDRTATERDKGAQARHDGRIDQRRPALAPVLPGEKAIPFAKAGARRGRGFGVAEPGEGEIADRNHMGIAAAGAAVAAAVAEGVKLLDIADRRAGLFGDPGAQANFEGSMVDRIEWARGQGREVATLFARFAARAPRHQNERGVAAHGHDRRRKADLHRDGRRGGDVHARSPHKNSPPKQSAPRWIGSIAAIVLLCRDKIESARAKKGVRRFSASVGAWIWSRTITKPSPGS